MRNNAILVFNDNTGPAALEKKLQQNYKVFTASSENDLLSLVNSIPVQLIICSLNSQAEKSYTICSQIKSSLQYAHIPVILLSPDDSLTSKIKSLEAGADACIIRPFSWKYLEAQIKNLITNRLKITAHFTCSAPAITKDNSNDVNEDFIKKLNECMVYNNGALTVEVLARYLNMSRPTLYRRIKIVTGQTPNELINLSRLTRAAELLVSTEYKVFEIANRVGFCSQSSFGKAFIKQYGITPTEYQRRNKKIKTPRRVLVPEKYSRNCETGIYVF
jgi:AraC-like DNA-binding protein